MFIRIMTVEEVPMACGFIRGIYDNLVRRFVQMELSKFFYEYTEIDNIKKMIECGELVLFGGYENGMLCAVGGIQNGSQITLTFVHPALMRKGYGKAIVKVMKDYAFSLGKTEIGVNVFPYNLAAFYKKCGFKTVENTNLAYIPMVFKKDSIREYEKRHVKGSVLATCLSLTAVAVIAVMLVSLTLLYYV